MTRPDIETIKTNLQAGGYSSMCKACTDRMAELIAYVEDLETQKPTISKPVVFAGCAIIADPDFPPNTFEVCHPNGSRERFTFEPS